MKICLYTDVHWSVYSSILRQRDNKYSLRLQNLIDSVNFVQRLAENNKCDRIMCLGDFFDKNTLNAEELDALKEIKWANIPQYFLVGNHEIVSTSDSYSSTQVFTSMGFEVIGSNCLEITDDAVLMYLPYATEENRESLSDCLDRIYCHYDYSFIPDRKIAFSHNDIKGIRYGAFESKEGYSVDEIEENCSLFINGHLHNSGFVNDNETILNLGNLSGMNFSEDGFKYDHYACILDTETLKLEFFTNPFSIYFYKLDINSVKDLTLFTKLRNKSIVSIRVTEELLSQVKQIIKDSNNIIASKITIFSTKVSSKEESNTFNVNYLDKLQSFCLEKIGNYDVLKQELSILCK